MKACEITLGGTYAAKVNGRVVPVRVERCDAWGYTFTNLLTGRRSQCRSSAKFRYAVELERLGGPLQDWTRALAVGA